MRAENQTYLLRKALKCTRKRGPRRSGWEWLKEPRKIKVWGTNDTRGG